MSERGNDLDETYLAKIEERAAAASARTPGLSLAHFVLVRDVPALIAEVRRLRAITEGDLK